VRDPLTTARPAGADAQTFEVARQGIVEQRQHDFLLTAHGAGQRPVAA
jgi:hypothetical protein